MKLERIERDKTSKLKHRRVKSRDGLLFYLHTSCMARASQHGRPTATVEFNTHIHKHTKRCIIHAHKKPIEKNSGRFLHDKNRSVHRKDCQKSEYFRKIGASGSPDVVLLAYT